MVPEEPIGIIEEINEDLPLRDIQSGYASLLMQDQEHETGPV